MARRSILRSVSTAVVAGAIAACSAAEAPSARPTPSAVTASPTEGVAGTPPPTAVPTAAPTAGAVGSLPPGMLGWPTTFDVAFSGTYWSSPPFRIPFAITVDDPGWFSGHVHEEFVDLQRFDGITPHQFPNRLLGFGDPDHVRGGDGDVDVAGLTPDAALDLLAARASLTTSNRTPQALLGLDGARIDLHSGTNSNPLFGNGTDNFGLGPQLDIRLVLLPHAERLLVVAVLAAPGDLDGAWRQALPLLGKVKLGWVAEPPPG